MRRTLVSVVLGIAVLALAACSSTTAAETSSPSTSASVAPSPTATPEPAALVLSLHEVEVVDADGATFRTAELAKGSDVEALLSDVLGAPASTTHDSAYSFTSTVWEGLGLSSSDGSSDVSVQFSSDHSGDIALRSSHGVSVGMTRAQVLATGAVLDYSYTDDKNVLNEGFVSDRETAAGTTSLTHPGETGSYFLESIVVDGLVAYVLAPADDFSDI